MVADSAYSMIIPFLVLSRKGLAAATTHVVYSCVNARFAPQVGIDDVLGVEAPGRNVDERHFL